MEKHECKLCFKSFSNGRALGGHMRSHMKKLPLPPKPEHASPPHTTTLLSFEAESASASSSSSSEDDDEIEEEDDKALSYGLRENPKKSIRLADPEFSFVVNNAHGHGSVILQDRESETESSRDPTRSHRSSNSKRNWKLGGDLDRRFHHHHHHHREIQELPIAKKLKSKSKISKTESSTAEPEPASSISDATTEEDVAFWLMMLSRDKWKRQKDAKVRIRYDDQDEEDEEEEEDDEDEDEDEDDEEEEEEEEEEGERSVDETDEESEENFKSSKNNRTRGRYTCETCKKAFRSYQALGGHRASHKKIKISTAAIATATAEAELEIDNNGGGTTTSSSMAVVDKKIHECPFCFRVFSSGQALGGHKRTHLTASASSAAAAAATVPIRASTKFVENLIDLNLPAPMEEDDASQIENSGVSYAEFVNSIRQ